MATISICMIVKNEEAVLVRCLDSLLGIPDEIIIVDTGSTDATMEIARRYTNHVYEYTWNNNFAEARNFSLSKASCEYIYTADADEVLDEENRARFLLLKKALFSEVEIVEMAYANQLSFNTTSNFDVEFRPKLFRRLRAFQFMDPIHEVLRTEPIVFRSDISVFHCPTGSHGSRDIALLTKLTRDGAALSDRLNMMFARELLIAGNKEDLTDAQPYFERILADESSNPAPARRAACVLSRLAALSNDASLLLRVAGAALVGVPPSEICCALGDYFFHANDAVLAKEWYRAALSASEPELVAAAAGNLPLNGLAACHERLGEPELAQSYREQAANWKPESLLAPT